MKYNKMKLKIKLLKEDSILPVKAHIEDAAFDCFVNSIETISKHKVKVGLGFAVEVPKGYMLNIVPRGSIGKTNWVLSNSYGVIDNGYIEEVFAVFNCISDDISNDVVRDFRGENPSNRATLLFQDFPFKLGDRCCQMFLQELIPTQLIRVNHIEGNRSGFGSTGK